ncbi:MAG: anaerobic ribonucleoside-triphosphate reductase activating protein [Ruminococcaceae bacterium]|nr:anaerobic ribonucleoside-triphosphate reductase activating protein [Oscillospiraceae bacterium]
MNYATIKKFDIANGPGVRVSLFVSGCRHYCKNCFNKEAWDFNYGKPFDEAVIEEIVKAVKPSHINGFTLLGGEPFEPENRIGLLPLLRRLKKEIPQKEIWCFTGFDFEKDLLNGNPGDKKTIDEMLSLIDVLVDGKFVEELKSPALIFRGSSNQRIIDVKTSIKSQKAVWLEGNWVRKMGTGDIHDGM